MPFLISFADIDPHSPRNGVHSPVANGTAFIAEYGDGLAMLHSEVDCDSDMIAAAIDALAIGESLQLEGAWGEVITIERASDCAALASLGFTCEIGGGGVTFLSLYLANGDHVYITGSDGDGMPTDSDWMIGKYRANWDGRQIDYVTSETHGATLLANAGAAVAFLKANPAPYSESI